MSVWKSFRPVGTRHPAARSLAGEEVIFISGQSGHTPEGTIPYDVADEARLAFTTLEALFQREGSDLDEVVWFHPYDTEVEYIEQITMAAAEAFGDARPAAGALLGNLTLTDPNMRLELDAIAVRGAKREVHQS